MDDRGWIDVRDRPPGPEDADKTKRVVVWHLLNGCMMIGWFRVKENRFVTHWMRCPEGPLTEEERRERLKGL